MPAVAIVPAVRVEHAFTELFTAQQRIGDVDFVSRVRDLVRRVDRAIGAVSEPTSELRLYVVRDIERPGFLEQVFGVEQRACIGLIEVDRLRR